MEDSDAGAVEVSVVLPCLNEEAGLGYAIDQAREGLSLAGRVGEVVVVDNGSEDRSVEIALDSGARVIHEEVRGYGAAYLAGLEAARGDYIVMADADGTYPLTRLPDFVSLLDQGDEMVIGSRFEGRMDRKAMPWLHRWIGNPVLTAVLNLFFGVKVADAHCGMRAVRRSVLPELGLRTTGMEFASEMIFKAARRGLRIGEVPIDYQARLGESKLRTFRDGWRHLRLLLVYSPNFLFLIPGLFLALVGGAVVLALAGGEVTFLGRLWGIHSMIAGAAALLIGAQLLQLGLFARTYAVLFLGEREMTLERAWSRVRLEHGLLAGALLLLLGLGVLTWVVVDWAQVGFGELERSHPALLGMVLVGLGVQTMFGSFFLSLLGLPTDLTPRHDISARSDHGKARTVAP